MRSGSRSCSHRRAGRRPTNGRSPSPSSACSASLRAQDPCWSPSTTSSGSIPPRRRSCRSPGGGCGRSRSGSCSRIASAPTPRPGSPKTSASPRSWSGRSRSAPCTGCCTRGSDLVLPRPALRRVHEVSGGNPFFAPRARPRAPGPRGRALARASRCRSPTASRSSFARGSKRCRRRAATSSPRRRRSLSRRSSFLPRQSQMELTPYGRRWRRRWSNSTVTASASHTRCSLRPRTKASTRSGAASSTGASPRLVADVDERARHLALSTDAPDSDVARALEEAAEHARARGATATAAELCEQACRLTPLDEPDAAHRRTVAAARYRFVAGDTARARALLEEALPSTRGGDGLAEALVLLGRLHRYEGDQPQAAELLRRALAETSASDRVRAEAAQGLAATLFFMREELEIAQGHAALAAELAARAGAFAVQAESLEDQGPHRSPARASRGGCHDAGGPGAARRACQAGSRRFAELRVGRPPVLDGRAPGRRRAAAPELRRRRSRAATSGRLR